MHLSVVPFLAVSHLIAPQDIDPTGFVIITALEPVIYEPLGLLDGPLLGRRERNLLDVIAYLCAQE